MTNISPGELAFWRSIKKTAYLLAFMIRLDRPAGEVDLASMLGSDRATIRSHLEALSALNYVARTDRYQSWIVTSGGRQLVLPLSAEPALPANDFPAISMTASDAHREGGIFPPSGDEINGRGKNPPSNGRDGGNFPPSSESSLKESESLNKTYFKDSDSDRLEKILSAAEKLLGEPIMTKCQDAELILAAVAEVWDRRVDLRSEGGGKLARIAEANLRPGRWIRAKYRKNPLSYLPMEFKVAAGLTTLTPAPLPMQGEGEEEDGCEETPAPVADESVHEITPAGRMTYDQAWTAAMHQLQMEMPRAAFEKYLAAAMLVDAHDGCLRVAVGGDYEAAWLESRLSSTCRRLLTGICNATMEVRFVVA